MEIEFAGVGWNQLFHSMEIAVEARIDCRTEDEELIDKFVDYVMSIDKSELDKNLTKVHADGMNYAIFSKYVESTFVDCDVIHDFENWLTEKYEEMG